MEEKLNELMEDPSFQEALSKTTSAEEASALLAQHGIQITPEELTAALAQPEGEMNENELDGVAGGCGWRFILIPWLPWWPPRPPKPFPPHRPWWPPRRPGR